MFTRLLVYVFTRWRSTKDQIEVRKKVGEKKILVTSLATNATKIVAEEVRATKK